MSMRRVPTSTGKQAGQAASHGLVNFLSAQRRECRAFALLTFAPGIDLGYSIVPNRPNQYTGERRKHPLRTVAK